MVRAQVVTVMRWYAQDEVNQEESEHNEVDGMKKEEGSWFYRWGDAYVTRDNNNNKISRRKLLLE